MAKQTDFIKQIQAAQQRVQRCQLLVDDTRGAYETAVKNKMLKASERLKGQLNRQEIALAHATAELREWENAKA